jgi:hypothetical protein
MSIDHELPFGSLIRYCVQQLHADLRTKADALRDEPDVVRRAHFLAFFEKARHVLVRLHSLCQWLGRNLPLLRAITVRARIPFFLSPWMVATFVDFFRGDDGVDTLMLFAHTTRP